MMDPNPPHHFEEITSQRPAREGWPVFRVGEEFEMNGVRMRVRKITRRDVVLRPLGMSGRELDPTDPGLLGRGD